MTGGIDAVAVIVPVHDEQELLPACLAGVSRAVAGARCRVARIEVIVVLDACTDDSLATAERAGAVTVKIAARSVGAARAAGVRRASELLATVPPERRWTAHTDADSVVPPWWLTHQLDLASAGADVVVGTVRPDFRDLSGAQIAAWRATHTPGVANGHVHGANLGVRGSWLADGGFPPIPVHEDVRLVENARANGAHVVASDAARVRTSGRSVGRAPDGYARYLRVDLLERVPSPPAPA